MNLIMNDDRLVSISQLEAFLKGVDGAVDFHPETRGNKNKQRMYQWIEHTLSRLRYHSSKKRERGVILSYMVEITRLSRVQLKRLAGRKKKLGKLLVKTEGRHRFATRYSVSDIARLIETDNLHSRLSGKATKAILEREWRVYGRQAYEDVRRISVSHIYNLRQTMQYTSQSLTFTKTQAVSTPIGTRKKPRPEGQPGYLRVDSVHQGDLEKLKGVYHINLVDEVTQWEIVACVAGISEEFLRPVLEDALAQFPFVILGFHSDNGSEYINAVVAGLLQKLLIEQTKSRARRTNDNALVESKNGSVVRKHFERYPFS
jgi:transposase InsO family protein